MRHYDELRPSVARGAFLVGVAVALVVLAAPWWCWLLLLPATAQVCLELALHRYLQDESLEQTYGRGKTVH